MGSDDWDPGLYARFGAERLQPLGDLLELLPPRVGGRWVDLGCGDGRATRWALERLGPASVIGVDRSEAMLDRAREEVPGATWVRQDLADWLATETDRFALVLSNAALHWIPDHATAVPSLLARVAPGGWVAVQLPMNHTAPTHTLMGEVARQPPFAEAIGDFDPCWPQRAAADYARALAAAGFTHTVVEVRTYRHPMPDAASIAAWTRATALRPWLARLPAALVEPFVQAYIDQLDRAIPPCDAAGTRLLDYRRLLLVGRRPPEAPC